jgi:hypothetical protein
MKPLFEAALTDVEAEDYKHLLAHGEYGARFWIKSARY